jgi:hypothetical protein
MPGEDGGVSVNTSPNSARTALFQVGDEPGIVNRAHLYLDICLTAL